MKRILCALLCALMVATLLVPALSISAAESTPVAAATVSGQQFTVMSCNIRYSSGTSDAVSLKWVTGVDDAGEYVYRVDNAITEILKLSPDIIGFQEFNFTEGTGTAVKKDTQIHDALIAAGYGVIAPTHTETVSDTSLEMPSQTAIYYKTAIFEAVDAAGAQGYLEYTHHAPVGTETGEQLYVRVVGSNYTGSSMPLKSSTTNNGAPIKELCKNSEYAPATLTQTEVDTKEYLNLTDFYSEGIINSILGRKTIDKVTFNADGSCTYSNTQYKGAYHTRSFLTATPGTNPGKSLTYGILKHKANGQQLLMISTHLAVWLSSFAAKADDYTYSLVKQWNQENAKELLATAESVWAQFGRLPTIAVGDFNMKNDHPTYSLLSEVFDDSARLAPDAIYWEGSSFDLHAEARNNPILDESGNPVTDTATGYPLYDVRGYRDDKAPAPGYSIDHIFCSQGDLEVLSYNVLNDTPEQRVITDHYALLTTFVLPDVQTPDCSHRDGIYRLEQSVTLAKGNDTDTIYYTLDGTDPKSSETRMTYTSTLTLYGDVQLRAVSYRDGKYSPERTVNFATGAELVITEMIKNNSATNILLSDGTKSSTNGEVFTGFEVVNASAHTVDLARYTYWHKQAGTAGPTADATALQSPDYSSVTNHLFVSELNRYLLAPGETAFIWFVTGDVYLYSHQIYNAAGDAGFVVDFTDTGKAIYNTDVAKAAFEYGTKTTMEVDLIVPLDATAAAFAGYYETVTDAEGTSTSTIVPRYRRQDNKANTVSNLSSYFTHYGDHFSRLFLTYNHEPTAKNALSTALIAYADGYNTNNWAKQGSFHFAHSTDEANGRVTSTANSHMYQKHTLGTLEEAEQAFADNLVRDLSYRAVTWNVADTLTTEYVLRNAVPAFAGSTDKAQSDTEEFAFTGWLPAPTAAPLSTDGTYLMGTAVTYVAQYTATRYAGNVLFLNADHEDYKILNVRLNESCVIPAAPGGAGVFFGWKSESGDFLPVGATYTVTQNIIFTPVYLDFATWAGAQMRTYEGSSGLRFRSSITAADYDTLCSLGTVNAIGTFIVPQAYVDAAGAFDVSLFARYIDVPYESWYTASASEYVLAGSVANILPQNYQLEFTACAYMRVTYSNGTAGLVYAAREENAGYSVYDVAYAAYNDRTTEADDAHDFVVEDEFGTSYSPYTYTQLEVMRPYLDHVLDLGIRAGELISISDTDYYTSPLAKCSWSYDEALDRIVVTAESADAWSNLYACYMDDDKVHFSVSGATLYIEYVIYSDFY